MGPDQILACELRAWALSRSVSELSGDDRVSHGRNCFCSRKLSCANKHPFAGKPRSTIRRDLSSRPAPAPRRKPRLRGHAAAPVCRVLPLCCCPGGSLPAPSVVRSSSRWLFQTWLLWSRGSPAVPCLSSAPLSTSLWQGTGSELGCGSSGLQNQANLLPLGAFMWCSLGTSPWLPTTGQQHLLLG